MNPTTAALVAPAQRDRSRTPEAKARTMALRAARARKLGVQRIGGAR